MKAPRFREFALALTLGLMAVGRAQQLPAVPNIQNHLTDENNKIPKELHQKIDDGLGQIQDKNKVDAAVVILPSSVPSVREMGQRCYEVWGIGKTWDAGLLLAITTDGQDCAIIQSSEDTPLSKREIAVIEREVRDQTRLGHFTEGVSLGVGRIRRIVSAKFKPAKVFPALENDPAKARSYGLGAVFVFIAALACWRVRPWR